MLPDGWFQKQQPARRWIQNKLMIKLIQFISQQQSTSLTKLSTNKSIHTDKSILTITFTPK
jgi:hypothetical protein